MTFENALVWISIPLLFVTLWFLIEEIWDLALFSRKTEEKEVTNLSTLRALGLFQHHDEITAFDVRPIDSFNKGHLPQAVNAPFEEHQLNAGSLETLDPTMPILVYCDGGYRSRKALPALVEAGFTRVYHLNRGLMMWRLFGGPTEVTADSPS